MPEKKEEKGISLWWTFVPVFLGVAGGLIAWKMNKKKHLEMSRVLLALGIIFTLIIIPFYLWLMTIY
ncbi:MAG: hypothetical protein J7K72_03685 [Candidatus Aenigmarchaeota archaeon]|nr:hypothetical protein [Candidatus Aenigmarchaeota archaeon]